MRKFKNKETGIILIPTSEAVIEQFEKSEFYEEVKDKKEKTSKNDNNE